MKLFIPLFISAFCLIGHFLYPWKNEDFFITGIGQYHLKGNDYQVEVFMDKNNKLNIRTTTPDSKSTWEDGWINPNQNWFLYVDKYNELWLSHNRDKLAYIYDFEKSSGIYSVNEYPNAEFKDTTLIKIIPEQVIKKLSPETLEAINVNVKTGDRVNPLD